jgi:hypothetical protein
MRDRPAGNTPAGRRVCFPKPPCPIPNAPVRPSTRRSLAPRFTAVRSAGKRCAEQGLLSSLSTAGAISGQVKMEKSEKKLPDQCGSRRSPSRRHVRRCGYGAVVIDGKLFMKKYLFPLASEKVHVNIRGSVELYPTPLPMARRHRPSLSRVHFNPRFTRALATSAGE